MFVLLIFQDAPDGFELDELVELAEDRVCWRAMVKAIEPEDALWEQRQLRSRKMIEKVNVRK
jgi:hypothetical protein